MPRSRAVATAFATLILSASATPALAEPSLRSDFAAMLEQFQAHGEPGKTGIAIGQASAAGKTFPLARIQVSAVTGAGFTLSRKILFVPDNLKDQSYGFRFVSASATELVYEVTQSAAGEMAAVTVRCRGRQKRPARGDIQFNCYRPEVERLGPSLAQPSFTFTFTATPQFSIGIGEGLDNIFTVDTNSDFKPRF
jgi:hypothetical protein